jgi:hypothetical protein
MRCRRSGPSLGRAGGTLAVLALVPALLPGVSLAAPTFTVDSIADVPGGGSLVDGVCETATGNHVCTLRAAVMEANHIAGGGARIVVPAGVYSLGIPRSAGYEEEGDLNVNAPMTVEGAGPSVTIVDGGQLDRVFFVGAATATIRDLSVRNGKPESGSVGGGIANWDGLTLENVIVRHNEASFGGGIYNQGTLTLSHCILRDNATTNGGGGLDNHGTAYIEDSIVENNSARFGGGVADIGATTIERSSISRNDAVDAFGQGGGIYSDGTLVLVNATVAQNGAQGPGGGIYVRGVAQLIHSTIADNIANSQFGELPANGYGGGIDRDAGGSVFFKSSILSGNLVGVPGGLFTYNPGNCGALSIASGDYNLWGFPGESCAWLGATTHDRNVDPALGGYYPNGGFSWDVALNPDSPAIDAVPPAHCTDALGAPLATDGRGYARKGSCDIGAHENYGGYLPDPLKGVELIRNGGAAGNEYGEARYSNETAYWLQQDGTLNQVIYGSPGSPSQSAAPPGSGGTLWWGGASSASQGEQVIDVSALATEIDTGVLRFRASGAFGGTGPEDDNAALDLYFTDGFLAELGGAHLGGFLAADRGNVTRLLRGSESGYVTPGTRAIVVVLIHTGVGGGNIDSYADDLSLVLPEPSGTLIGVAALAALVEVRRFARGARRRS